MSTRAHVQEMISRAKEMNDPASPFYCTDPAYHNARHHQRNIYLQCAALALAGILRDRKYMHYSCVPECGLADNFARLEDVAWNIFNRTCNKETLYRSSPFNPKRLP